LSFILVGLQTLAASRLYELQEAQEDNLIMSKQLEVLQVKFFLQFANLSLFLPI